MKTLLTTIAIMTLAGSASAFVMLSPAGVVQNTLGSRVQGTDVILDHAYSGAGLPAFTSGVTDFDAYLATTPLHTFVALNNEWFAPTGVSTGVIDWDLGSVQSVDRVAIWNEDAHGVQRMNIYTSNDPGFGVSTFIGAFTLTDTTVNADYPADVLAIGGPAARYVRFEILSSYNGSLGQPTASLGEVVFSVPTPGAAGVLALAGLAGVRRRR